MIKLIIDNDIQERVDVYISKILLNFSRSKIQNEIKNKKCRINGKIVTKSSYTTKLNDVIEFDNSNIEKELICEPENISLEIIWEDENMAVINKPFEMLTHPTESERHGTLVNALLGKYKENLSDNGGTFRRGIVHRLDRNTSGLIMIAKNNETHEFLTSKMKNKEFIKKYRAIVKGVINEDNLIINTPIGRHFTQQHKMMVNGKDAKESLTKVHVIERYSDATDIDIELVTGRTHQIRVHMASIHHPVFNDTLYGFGKIKIKTHEQVLQSYSLTFKKPFSEEIIKLEIPPDDDFLKVKNFLSNK